METGSQQTYAKKALDWARRNVIATIIVGLLGIAAPLGIYLDSSRQEDVQEKEISTQEDESSEPSQPRISISSIHVSEVAMDIPAAFELELHVGGFTSLAVHDIDVVLDFGRAEIEVCDYTPEVAVTNVLAEDKSHRRIKIEKLQQEEKFYIRCLITSPVFNRVIINAGNIDNPVSMDFEQYQSRQRYGAKGVGFWTVIGRCTGLFFIIILCAKMFRWLFDID